MESCSNLRVFTEEGINFVVETDENGEKTLSINATNININLNGVRLVTVAEKVKLCKIYDFVNKYKYDGDEIATKIDGISKDVPICIKGIEFHTHWVEESNKDVDYLKFNEFVPDYQDIIYSLSDLDDEISSQFLSPKYYEDEFNDFISKLKKMGITVEESAGNEYDVLMTFSLPSDKLDNNRYINKFMKLLIDYKSKFNEELDVLYGN